MTEKNQEERRRPKPKAVVGRDELNLIEIPFSLPTKKNRQSTKQDRISVVKRTWSESSKERYLTISGSAEFGMPTTWAEDVYIAAQELTYRNDFTNREVHATKQDFLELMGWHDNGQYRRRLVTSFSELTGVTIYTNGFWNHAEKKHLKAAERGFGIIDDFTFYDDEEHKRKGRGDQLALPLSYFRWNQVVFDSFRAGYIRRLDTPLYYSLNLPLSKTMFRIAGKVTYQERVFECDLLHFAFNRLLMSTNYRQPSRVAQKLKPALAELAAKAKAFFIEVVKSKGTFSGYKVVIRATGRHQSARKSVDGVQEQGSAKAASERENEAPTGTPDADQSASRDEQRLLKLLSDRGVKGRTSKELVAKHPNRIQRQVAVYDWIQKKEPHRIDGDGQGFLVASIRDDYTPPPAFITADLAEKEADKREAQQILLAEYEQDVEKLLGWLKDWEQLPLEKRINFQMLDQWIRDFRRRSKRNPMDKEHEQQVARMVKNLLPPMKMRAQKISALQGTYQARAAEQGMELHLPAPEGVRA